MINILQITKEDNLCYKIHSKKKERKKRDGNVEKSYLQISFSRMCPPSILSMIILATMLKEYYAGIYKCYEIHHSLILS